MNEAPDSPPKFLADAPVRLDPSDKIKSLDGKSLALVLPSGRSMMVSIQVKETPAQASDEWKVSVAVWDVGSAGTESQWQPVTAESMRQPPPVAKLGRWEKWLTRDAIDLVSLRDKVWLVTADFELVLPSEPERSNG
ncbi:hypothetical protein CfE428DRAFT_4003 [Chthoniobacter flavus Ellin428]|uniref:Uncharacterized protein n=1 Tax=Chthoniobacter flavus Ellin428 TaxID=497964 RepID=B4D514_9BACT|nr:hypothetical protein [Chthoniobacter flavus]EDY18617.1 hypothetical protein CfE428DRAFT_4003 [Chthoniobacter flavus Ellin428]TCO90927.1 hypothetical protein EV701_10976 [Chthoniobacter flavus]